MGLGFSQEMRLEQKTVLSQRMIQSMELLQLPLLQLEERIDQELMANPVLEQRADSEDPEDDYGEYEGEEPESAAEVEESPEPSVSERENEHDTVDESDSYTGEEESDFGLAADFASTYSDTIDESPARSQSWLEDESQRHNDVINSLPSPEESLVEHLEEQLHWFELSPEKLAWCEKIISHLDSSGYLSGSLDELLDKNASEADRRLAEESLAFVQTLEPCGVGARDLTECLLLQIRPGVPLEKEMRCLITSHLEDLEKNRYPLISKQTGYSFDLIEQILEEIRQLNPRPGLMFRHVFNSSILPDVYVEELEDGSLQVRVASGRGSGLYISGDYRRMLKQKGTDPKAKDFLRKKIGSARWLLEALQQRQATLQRVSEEIVDYQKDFFKYGPRALKPLKLQQIADRVHIHITTVSRACEGKWMQSPQGILPLKRFFTGSIASTEEGENAIAQDTVRLKLQELVGAEDKSNPLSDEELVSLMEKEGIRIKRRTIAKYRQILNIPGSRQRRSWT